MADYGNITTMKPLKTISISMVQPTHSMPLAEKVKVQINLAKVAKAKAPKKAFLCPLNPEHESKEAAAEPAQSASFS